MLGIHSSMAIGLLVLMFFLARTSSLYLADALAFAFTIDL